MNVLSRGEHSGFEWVVAYNRFGYRCGYVRIFNIHPWYGKNYHEIEVDVHGGLTFGKFDKNRDYWLGFDCNHYGDSPDPSLSSAFKFFLGGTIKDQEYVEHECQKLCEAAAAIMPAPLPPPPPPIKNQSVPLKVFIAEQELKLQNEN